MVWSFTIAERWAGPACTPIQDREALLKDIHPVLYKIEGVGHRVLWMQLIESSNSCSHLAASFKICLKSSGPHLWLGAWPVRHGNCRGKGRGSSNMVIEPWSRGATRRMPCRFRSTWLCTAGQTRRRCPSWRGCPGRPNTACCPMRLPSVAADVPRLSVCQRVWCVGGDRAACIAGGMGGGGETSRPPTAEIWLSAPARQGAVQGQPTHGGIG